MKTVTSCNHEIRWSFNTFCLHTDIPPKEGSLSGIKKNHCDFNENTVIFFFFLNKTSKIEVAHSVFNTPESKHKRYNIAGRHYRNHDTISTDQ